MAGVCDRELVSAGEDQCCVERSRKSGVILGVDDAEVLAGPQGQALRAAETAVLDRQPFLLPNALPRQSSHHLILQEIL